MISIIRNWRRPILQRIYAFHLYQLRFVSATCVCFCTSLGLPWLYKIMNCESASLILALITIITSLPKVIWEEGRVAALSHTYAVKSPLVTMARPKFGPKSTPSSGPIPKPHYLRHPWARPTYDAKRHPDPIRRFATMHWTDRPTDARTYVQTDRSSTWKFDDYRPLRNESDVA